MAIACFRAAVLHCSFLRHFHHSCCSLLRLLCGREYSVRSTFLTVLKEHVKCMWATQWWVTQFFGLFFYVLWVTFSFMRKFSNDRSAPPSLINPKHWWILYTIFPLSENLGYFHEEIQLWQICTTQPAWSWTLMDFVHNPPLPHWKIWVTFMKKSSCNKFAARGRIDF